MTRCRLPRCRRFWNRPAKRHPDQHQAGLLVKFSVLPSPGFFEKENHPGRVMKSQLQILLHITSITKGNGTSRFVGFLENSARNTRAGACNECLLNRMVRNKTILKGLLKRVSGYFFACRIRMALNFVAARPGKYPRLRFGLSRTGGSRSRGSWQYLPADINNFRSIRSSDRILYPLRVFH